MLATVDKKELAPLEAALAGYPSPTTPVTVSYAGAPPALAEETDSATLLAQLQAQSEGVVRLAELVAQRQALFAHAVAAWDALKPAVTDEPVPAPKRKSKPKRGGETVVERPCGWDARLVWGDEEVRAWRPEEAEAEGGGEGGGQWMCMAGRRCERHQGWQKTLGVALDVEAAQLVS